MSLDFRQRRLHAIDREASSARILASGNEPMRAQSGGWNDPLRLDGSSEGPQPRSNMGFELQISLEAPARSGIMAAPSQREMRDRESSRNSSLASSARRRSGIPVRHFKSKILMSSKTLRERLRIRVGATAGGGSRGPVARCRMPARQSA